MITLRRKSLAPDKIYFAFVVRDSLAMFSAKIENIGYMEKEQRYGRVHT